MDSLTGDMFKPFTNTKTCVIFLQKRKAPLKNVDAAKKTETCVFGVAEKPGKNKSGDLILDGDGHVVSDLGEIADYLRSQIKFAWDAIMPLLAKRSVADTLLALDGAAEEDMFQENHIFEPEFHQDRYREPVERLGKGEGNYQVNRSDKLARPIARGIQPKYADSEDDPSSLEYEGQVLQDGSVLDSASDTRNVCALKSNCVRWGFIDLSLARSVKRDWATTKAARAIVQKNDVLVNSTGDGTIGRVAVYDFDAPAVVDGHISIIRYNDISLAWYVAAFLLSKDGQNQLYRYINGSSGQVELYPQDIGRVWVPNMGKSKQTIIGNNFRKACEKHYEFFKDMRRALSLITTIDSGAGGS